MSGGLFTRLHWSYSKQKQVCTRFNFGRIRGQADPLIHQRGWRRRSLYDEGNRLKLLFGQWQFHLIIQTFYFATDKRGPYTEIGAREILSPGRSGWITVTSDTNGTSIYFEGHDPKRCECQTTPAMADFSGYRIYLGGNKPDVRAPWKGELYGLGLYDRANRFLKATEAGLPIPIRWKERQCRGEIHF